MAPDSASARGPVRVLLVGPTLDDYPGGIAIQADRLAKRFKEVDDVVLDLQTITPKAPKPFDRLQRIPGIRTLVTSIVYFAQLVRRIPRYHVVHVNSAKYSSFMISSFPAIVLGKVAGKPVILNYRNGNLGQELERYPGFRLLLSMADRLVVPSEFLARELAAVRLESTVIANQVDLARFKYRERQPLRPVFLSCRHFEDFYDVPTLIRAFHRIQEQVPDATLTVAGKGSQESTVRSLVEQLNLEGVRFLGQVEPAGMPRVYDECDILLNSSQVDNMPGSLVEALAAGLPIVSTDAGGIPFIVTHGKTGRLAPIRDPEGLAREALAALADPRSTVDFARAGLADAKARYTWEAVRDKWIELYAGLRDGKKPKKVE